MEGMFLNVDLSAEQTSRRTNKGSGKHESFVRKRRFLEKRGFLKQKQLPQKPPNRRQPANSWNSQPDVNGNSYDRTWRPKSNTFHMRGSQQHKEPSEPTRTVTMGAPHPSSTLTISVNSAPNHSRVATFTSKQVPCIAPTLNHQPAGVCKLSKPTQPDPSLLSEFESGIPAVSSAPSYKMVAIDCEMVGTGLKGRNSDLARCSIVNYQGDVVFDKYIKPANPVTDYRTRWSGIRREHLVNATPFAVAQKEILKILNGKIVIGHAIQNDYKAIGYFHPKEMTRDTSKIPLLNRKAGFPEKEIASLKRLAKELLHKNIQAGRAGHSSVEDAKTTMELYRMVEVEYERELAAGGVPQ